MAMILRAAVEKWGIQPVKRTTKEYFNQEECRTLWCQLDTEDLEQQLRNRLEARELGLFLPHSDERLYFKWLKQLSDPAEHSRAMILLQRTQELKKAEWEALHKDAISRLGKGIYLLSLEEVGNLLAPILRPLNASVGPQNILLAALKEEENGGGTRLEDQISEIVRSLRSGDSDSMISILKGLVPHSEEARKMQHTGYRAFQRLKEDRRLIDRIMSESTLGPSTVGWLVPETTTQTQDRVLVYQSDHWREFLIQWSHVKTTMRTASEAQLLTCLRDLLDQWKWFEEAKRLMEGDLIVAWKDLKEWEQKLASPGWWMDGRPS
jgi:hypothetical protein